MVFLGVQAVASPIWGLITQHLGLGVAVSVAAALVGVSAVDGLAHNVPRQINWIARPPLTRPHIDNIPACADPGAVLAISHASTTASVARLFRPRGLL